MEFAVPFPEVTEAIISVAGETLRVCIQCGTCTGLCPWNLVTRFSPREMIRLAQFGLEGFESEALWRCVTCRMCVQRCPRGVEIIDVVRSMRALMYETGTIPSSLKAPIGSLTSRGNPWGGEKEARLHWASELSLPEYREGTEYFFFVCCTQAYDPRNQRAAKALVRLLQVAGVDFGVIGEEVCCGDACRKLGGEETFTRLAEANAALFASKNASKVLVASPHCFNAFRKDYRDILGAVEVFHYSILLANLIEQGNLRPKKELPIKITYHDPCYLGRHNGIYEPPRQVIRSIPGVELLEMRRNRDESLCCGGGGGGIWMEVPSGERFSELRVTEAEETGAQVIVAACPYCISMFEDALKTTGRSERMRVMELSELLLESIEQ